MIFGWKLNLSHRNPGKRAKRCTAHVMLRGVEHKSCARCASLKPLTEYSADHHTSDELRSYCRACVREINGEARKRGAA